MFIQYKFAGAFAYQVPEMPSRQGTWKLSAMRVVTLRMFKSSGESMELVNWRENTMELNAIYDCEIFVLLLS